jgi:hypothetical protein
MILGQLSKTIALPAVSSATNGTASVGPFDVQGFDSINLKVLAAVASATNASAKWSALDVLCGDSTAFTAATVVPGLSGTTNSTASTSQFVLGVWNDTSVSSCTKLNVSGNKHRYYFVRFTGATGYNTATVVVDAFNGAQTPNTAAEAGAASIASAADTL